MRKTSWPTYQNTVFRRKSVYFAEENVLLKQPIRFWCLIKPKPRGTLAGKQGCMRRRR